MTENQNETNKQDKASAEGISEEINGNDEAQNNDTASDKEETKDNNLETKFNEINDKYLRLLAENQNLRKNHEQEKEDILKYGSFNFAQQILSLTDNLDRAFQIFKNDEKFKSEEFKNILSGIEMIEKDLQNTLEKNSIKYIDCIGKTFDPNLHQAIGEKESDQEPGTVLEEMQKGYLMHERLLRPSMVFVAKKQVK